MQNSSDCDQWHMAVQQEKQSLEKMEMFILVKNTPKKPIQSKYVFKKKLNSDGTLERYKTRLIAKGFT